MFVLLLCLAHRCKSTPMKLPYTYWQSNTMWCWKQSFKQNCPFLLFFMHDMNASKKLEHWQLIHALIACSIFAKYHVFVLSECHIMSCIDAIFIHMCYDFYRRVLLFQCLLNDTPVFNYVILSYIFDWQVYCCVINHKQ